MEWTCEEDCWCHIPVQGQRGPPCYQCVLRNCSFSYPLPPKPSAPPLFGPHEDQGLSRPPHFLPCVCPEPSAPPLPLPLLKKRNSSTIRAKTEIQKCFDSGRTVPHVEATMEDTEDCFLPSPITQAYLKVDNAVLSGWEKDLQRNSHDENVKKKKEPIDLSTVLRELLLDHEDMTSAEDTEESCVLHEENTLSAETGTIFSMNDDIHKGSSITKFANDFQECQMKGNNKVKLSGVGGSCLAQRQSMQAMTLDESLDEEAYKRINKINRRESWKCAEQRHRLDGASVLGGVDP